MKAIDVRYLSSVDARDEMLYELSQRLRSRFVASYAGKELYFALSLANARWDDCTKDVERGRVTESRAVAILGDAVKHSVICPAYAAHLRELWGLLIWYPEHAEVQDG